MGNADGIFSSRLISRNVPGKTHDAVDDPRGTGCNRIAFRAFDFIEGYAGGNRRIGSSYIQSRYRSMAIRAKHDAADVKLFAGTVDRLIGRDVRGVAFGAAKFDRDWWCRGSGRLAAKDQSRGDEKAADGGKLEHVTEPQVT